jgi:cytochrome c oxidase accessory protein FixG
VIVAFVTVAMMVDFAFLREQVCSVMCPYARFQSVLLDRHSLVVKYDAARGEPRGRKGVKSSELRVERGGLSLPVLATPDSQLPTRTNDCVDCTMCVQVCPAGIDIRDGLQLECIHCAQCVDACDAVMTKLKRPTGLIRYASQAAMEGGPVKGFLRPRTVIYAAVVVGLLSLLTVLLVTKSPTDVLLVRNQGLPFVFAPDGRVENTMRVQLTNREGTEQTVKIAIAGDATGLEIAEAAGGADVVTLKPQEAVQKPIHVLADPKLFAGVGKKTITVRVTTTGGREIDRTFQLFGPAAVK